MKYKIGDRVKVIDARRTQSTNKSQFEDLGFKNKIKNSICGYRNNYKNEIYYGIIFNINDSGYLALDLDNGEQALIHNEGVILVPNKGWIW